MILLLIHIVTCICLAADNADRIRNGDKINHTLNGAIHLVMAVLVAFLTDWLNGLCILLVARVSFDTALNLFRGLSIGYVSPKPASKVDRIEKYFFQNNGILPKILYVMITICLQLFK